MKKIIALKEFQTINNCLLEEERFNNYTHYLYHIGLVRRSSVPILNDAKDGKKTQFV